MELSKLLEKLEPLLPEKTRAWQRTLDVAQPETRALVERQIRHTAQRVLGEYRKEILLSLPPTGKAKGAFQLGTILYGEEKWPAGITRGELMQNLAVFGRSGAGKTNAVFHLLQQLPSKRIPFLFLDWKRTGRHLIPLFGKKLKVYTPGRSLAPFPFNPLIPPPGLDRNIYVQQAVDVLASAYTLGDGAKSILHKALAAAYSAKKTPTFSDVLESIEKMPTKERATGWKMTAQRAIESVAAAMHTSTNPGEQQRLARSLLQQNTILELDALSQNSKKFLIPLLCSWIYSVKLSEPNREHLSFVLVIEEAHHTLYRQEQRSSESLMNTLLRQGRELGIGCIIVDQHPHLISSAALGNCYTTICLNLKDPTDINKAAGLSLVADADRHYFSRLPVGQGIVKLQDRWSQPFLVKIPLSPVRKGHLTDEMLKSLSEGTLSLAELRKQSIGELHAVGIRGAVAAMNHADGRSSLGGLFENRSTRLIEDVARFPDDGVDARYKRLGVSVDQGNRWKQQLLLNGILDQSRVKSGRAHRVVLRLTDQARNILTSSPGSDPQASFLHEYIKQRISRRLQHDGYRVTLEAARTQTNGNMDILATRASESIAFEIETGKSDSVANVKRDLLEHVNKVVVVATDDPALTKIERQLAKAGLLIPTRVSIVLPNQEPARHS